MDFSFENMGQPNIRAIIEMRYRMNAKRIWMWSGIYLILGVYFLREYLLGYSYLISTVICFACAAYFALNPYFRVRKGWKEELAFHNGTMPTNMVRFGEKISIANIEESHTWEYHHLIKVHSFKYSYCLHFADKRMLLLGRENFTKGTFEEFKQFLRTRRPDLNIPE